MGPLDPGSVVPDLLGTYEDATGNRIDLGTALTAGSLLLCLYKSSCAASKAMLPMLERIQQRHAGDGLRTYGVAQDSANVTRSFARRYGITFPIVIEGPTYPVSVAFDILWTPTVVVIDSGGTIAYSTTGFLRAQVEEIEAAVAGALGVPPVTIVTPDLEDVPLFVPG